MKWAGHTARTEVRNVYAILARKNLSGGEQMGDLGVDGRTILKWILKIQRLGWTQLTQDRIQ